MTKSPIELTQEEKKLTRWFVHPMLPLDIKQLFFKEWMCWVKHQIPLCLRKLVETDVMTWEDTHDNYLIFSYWLVKYCKKEWDWPQYELFKFNDGGDLLYCNVLHFSDETCWFGVEYLARCVIANYELTNTVVIYVRLRYSGSVDVRLFAIDNGFRIESDLNIHNEMFISKETAKYFTLVNIKWYDPFDRRD